MKVITKMVIMLSLIAGIVSYGVCQASAQEDSVEATDSYVSEELNQSASKIKREAPSMGQEINEQIGGEQGQMMEEQGEDQEMLNDDEE
ncbi:MAG: hypothetical protein PHW46_03900 [Candidatus Omnitrophica bacterium]|nr:hypothetical protein [Candidatus Omnitrophota bacterium]